MNDLASALRGCGKTLTLRTTLQAQWIRMLLEDGKRVVVTDTAEKCLRVFEMVEGVTTEVETREIPRRQAQAEYRWEFVEVEG